MCNHRFVDFQQAVNVVNTMHLNIKFTLCLFLLALRVKNNLSSLKNMIRLNGRLIKKIILYGAVIFAVVLLLSQFHSPIHIQVLNYFLFLFHFLFDLEISIRQPNSFDG